MRSHISFIIDQATAGKRLDKAMADLAPEGFSRARLQSLLAQGCVTCGGAVVRDASYKVKEGEVYLLEVPPALPAEPQAQAIALDIIFEDSDLLVLNKPAGMVVHPAAGNHDGTLVNALLAHCGESLSGIGGVRRPGIVHRLDKETSGLMVVAKNDLAHGHLSAQLSSRTLSRVYQALVWGNPAPISGRIETLIGRSKSNRKKMAVRDEGGKEAITDYQVLESYGTLASLVECRLRTGRTHQIRVHMAHIGHWLVGDPVYGPSSTRRLVARGRATENTAEALLTFKRQALHAAEISFEHPASGKTLSFKAAPPVDMQSLISALREGSI